MGSTGTGSPGCSSGTGQLLVYVYLTDLDHTNNCIYQCARPSLAIKLNKLALNVYLMKHRDYYCRTVTCHPAHNIR
ncbi:hypothetical protein EMIT0P74_60238 [Pseudomonas sp. IT-P74]